MIKRSLHFMNETKVICLKKNMYSNRNVFSLFIGLNAKTSNYMLVDSLGPAKVVMSEEDIKEDDDEDMNEEDDSEEEEEEELMEDDTEEVETLVINHYLFHAGTFCLL